MQKNEKCGSLESEAGDIYLEDEIKEIMEHVNKQRKEEETMSMRKQEVLNELKEAIAELEQKRSQGSMNTERKSSWRELFQEEDNGCTIQ